MTPPAPRYGPERTSTLIGLQILHEAAKVRLRVLERTREELRREQTTLLTTMLRELRSAAKHGAKR